MFLVSLSQLTLKKLCFFLFIMFLYLFFKLKYRLVQCLFSKVFFFFFQFWLWFWKKIFLGNPKFIKILITIFNIESIQVCWKSQKSTYFNSFITCIVLLALDLPPSPYQLVQILHYIAYLLVNWHNLKNEIFSETRKHLCLWRQIIFFKWIKKNFCFKIYILNQSSFFT